MIDFFFYEARFFVGFLVIQSVLIIPFPMLDFHHGWPRLSAAQ